MANIYVQDIIKRIEADFGMLKRIGTGNSLYLIESIDTLIYFRYSKLTINKTNDRGFFGLRSEDIKLCQGHNAFICFINDKNKEPILIPFKHFEYEFGLCPPSSDGQYKVLSFKKKYGTELYLANVGKYNVDAYYGLSQLYTINKTKIQMPELSHSDVQSLLGAIGIKKGYHLWYPENDRLKIDDRLIDISKVRPQLPNYSSDIANIISEVDVIWLDGTKPVSYFEVEHTTPIYSGLLRFNDILLSIAGADNFNIVAPNERESKFSREIRRPTFRQNKLIDKVSFLDYQNVYEWYGGLYEKA